ncbi:germacrene A acid 8-beta-hydroxylase-like [Lotus japonicus]|uniref:germacrene A acid 8-beta-hydroxylase-like n=1 Tax=Lotus japonicus TaxID=34305 RepID=UPI00258AFAA0|nr:germacrene A acid 8-beta-hydroxylase-like [Lotus japonicus]
MCEQGYKKTTSDHCVFIKKFADDDFIILLLYVDDMLIVGKNISMIDRLKKQLGESFAMKDLGAARQILGIRIMRDRKEKKLWLSQEHYVKRVLQRFHMQKTKAVSTPLAPHFKLSAKQSPSNEAEKSDMQRVPYASAVGSLMYAMVCTRPNIAHAVGTVSRFLSNPGREHWNAVKWILRYLYGTSSMRLCFGGDKPTLVGYTDSDMAGDIDSRKSTSGYLIKFAEGAVAWQSRLQRCVALSTTQAEFIAITEACKELIWLKKFLQELGFVQDKYLLFCDSQSAIHLGKNSTFHSRSKHIDVRYHWIRDALDAGLLELAKVHTDDNGADMMTKLLHYLLLLLTDSASWGNYYPLCIALLELLLLFVLNFPSIASKEGSEINLTQAVIQLMYTFTSKAAFGKKYEEQEEFISEVKQIIKLAGGFYIGDLFPSAKWLHNFSGMRPRLEKLNQVLDRILDNIINDHKKARSRAKEALVEAEGDLIDVLLKFEDSSIDLDFCLTTNNVKAIIMELFIGGSDTASGTINWAMAEMIKNTEVLKRAQVEVREVFGKRGKVDENGIEDLKYLKAIIKEVLRLHPIAPLLLPRECGEACEINGYTIPVKSRVIVNAWAIGRDPKYWTNPDKFYPERFIDSSIDYKGTDFEYIPFGAGRRICPGLNLGMANVEQVLAFLLYHFDWRLSNGVKNKDLDMTEEFGVAVSRKDDLYLIPTISQAFPTKCSTVQHAPLEM